MENKLFKLKSTYELILSQGDESQLVRIEIFALIEDSNYFKARVWFKNTYNLYPMVVNTGPNGEDLHRIHSSDDINTEITSMIAEEESFMLGKHYENEEEFLNYISNRVKEFIK